MKLISINNKIYFNNESLHNLTYGNRKHKFYIIYLNIKRRDISVLIKLFILKTIYIYVTFFYPKDIVEGCF